MNILIDKVSVDITSEILKINDKANESFHEFLKNNPNVIGSEIIFAFYTAYQEGYKEGKLVGVK